MNGASGGVPKPISKIVIVGGGTAGWMTAAALSRLNNSGVSVTLIESDAIATVGVGEATIPPIRSFNGLLGIDENDFLAKTQGTIKLGIEFDGWLREGERYVHPFGEFGFDIEGVRFHHFWRKFYASGHASGISDYNLSAMAMRLGRYQNSSHDPASIFSRMSHAYQFDAGLYAAYLRDYSERRGVRRIEGKVVHVPLRADDGFIDAVVLEGDRRIDGELFIDCTGFRALLIEQTLKTGWDSWSHWLQCDRAVAVPSTASDTMITPFTRATALRAGWQWRIPLQHRIGNGYVYCSNDISDDAAHETLLENLDGPALRDPFIIKFESGRRKKAWNKNCVALGLSSGFLEPLESTSIHFIQSGISKLLALLPDTSFRAVERDEFNRLTNQLMEQVRDFIILHYHANQRRDGDLWRRMREMDVPETLRRKMALFKGRGRIFRSEDDLFAEPSWIAVLLGQGIMPDGWDPLADGIDPNQIRHTLDRLKRLFAETANNMPRHEQWLAHNAPARRTA